MVVHLDPPCNHGGGRGRASGGKSQQQQRPKTGARLSFHSLLRSRLKMLLNVPAGDEKNARK